MLFKNKFEKKKILVIGHTGFKGSWLTLWLKRLGADVYGYSKDIPTIPSHFELLKLDSLIHDSRNNIIDRDQLFNFFEKVQPEIVFHLGANAIVSDCIANPHDAFMSNAIGTLNVLEAIRQTPSVKTAVMITSDKCYENVEWEYGYRESDRLGGKDPYSASKACAELIFSSYFKTYLKSMPHLKIATARAGNVIGGGDWAKDRIIPDCIRAWKNNQKVEIRNPNSTRPWQHVLEPLSGYLALAAELMEQTNLNGESFNFGPSAEVNKPVHVLIQEIKKHWTNADYFCNTNHTLSNKEAMLLKLSCDKSLHWLNWKPTLSFEETTELTAKWYLSWNTNNTDIEKLTTEQIKKYETLAKERNISWAKGL